MYKQVIRNFKPSGFLNHHACDTSKVTVYVDNKPHEFNAGQTILQACGTIGMELATVCSHPRLTPAANCRFCLVEIVGDERLRPACKTQIQDGMKVLTSSEKVQKAQIQLLKFVVVNHPNIKCVKCSEDVECGLKTECTAMSKQKFNFGGERTSTYEANFGPFLTLIMKRCVHCTRCIRFNNEILGKNDIGTTGRGRGTEIGTYISKQVTSELSGCLADVCPVAALYLTPIASVDPHALVNTKTHDVLDPLGTPISIGTEEGKIQRIFPKTHEGINEEWMSDRTRWAFDGLKRQRLDSPLFKDPKTNNMKNVNWNEAFDIVKEKFQSTDRDSVVALIGQHADLESIVALRDFFHSMGVETIEAKDQGQGTLSPDFRANYLLNSKVTGVEEADLLVLVGTNPKLECPVFNARIKKAVNHGNLKVVLIGTADDLTYEYEHAGNTTKTLDDVLSGNHSLNQQLREAKKPMVILGSHQVEYKDGNEVLSKVKKICKDNNVVRKDWNGFNILQKDISRPGALDVGIKTHQSWVKPPKLVFLLGCDNFNPQDVPKDAFVVYLGSHADAGAQASNVILPGLAYTEKKATYVNIDGRVIQTVKVVESLGQSRLDWEVIRDLAQACGKNLPYSDEQGLNNRLSELAPHLGKVDSVQKYNFSDLAIENLQQPSTKSKPRVLKTWIDNFYFTDPISRNSKILAKAVTQLGPARQRNFL